MMAYRSARRIFQPGEHVVFDDAYRLAHLPLVNAGHPAAITELDGRDYQNGTYEKARYALVMPISAEVFQQSDQFQALEREMKSSAFSSKIAWGLCETRRSRLHATLASGLLDADLDRWTIRVQEVLDRIGPISICLKGPFAGNRNTGRVYLPVYPQKIGGADSLALVQQAIGAPQTGLYLVGYYHFLEELDSSETAELAHLIDRWCDRVVAHMSITYLELHATNDDLALSARSYAKILTRREG